eukprot:scaffold15123_cov200-Alexandrium_tamarense.AAC.5
MDHSVNDDERTTFGGSLCECDGEEPKELQNVSIVPQSPLINGLDGTRTLRPIQRPPICTTDDDPVLIGPTSVQEVDDDDNNNLANRQLAPSTSQRSIQAESESSDTFNSNTNNRGRRFARRS